MSSNAKSSIDSETAHDFSIPELVNFLKSTYRSIDYERVTKLLVTKNETMRQEALNSVKRELVPIQKRYAEMAVAKMRVEDALKRSESECAELRRKNLKLEEEKKQMSNEVLRVKKEIGIIEGRNVEMQISKRNKEELIACRNEYYELKEKMLRSEKEKKLIGGVKSEDEAGKLARKKQNAVALVERYKRRDIEIGARVSQLVNDVEILRVEHPSFLTNDQPREGLPSAGVVEITDGDDEEMGANTLASGLKRKRDSPFSVCDTEASRHGSQTAGLHGDICSTVPAPSHANTSEALRPGTEQPSSEQKAGRNTSGDFLRKLVSDISSDSSDSEDDWKNEKDMRAEFETDPELCMRAVCALYKEKCFEMKTDDDALRGTKLAEFLTDMDPRHALKRSFTEFLKHDSKGLDGCRKLAMKYSDKLFEIYMKCGDSRFMIE